MRNAPAKGHIALPMGFYKDINWFIRFLEKFNGMVNFYSHAKVTHEIFVDASLNAVGAKYGNVIYTCDIPDTLKSMGSIVHFEAANILLAARCWAKKWADATVLIYCDNLAVVNAFTHNRMRDNILMTIIRSVWLYTAAYNINLIVKHISGANNVYANVLSRWPHYCSSNTTVVQFLKICKWEQVLPNDLIPNFQI